MITSVLLRLLAAVVRPDAATCPSGWWLDSGVRPSGEYRCVLTRGDDDSPAVAVLASRVYCPSGTEPRVVTWRTVRCVHVRSST